MRSLGGPDKGYQLTLRPVVRCWDSVVTRVSEVLYGPLKWAGVSLSMVYRGLLFGGAKVITCFSWNCYREIEKIAVVTGHLLAAT